MVNNQKEFYQNKLNNIQYLENKIMGTPLNRNNNYYYEKNKEYATLLD